MASWFEKRRQRKRRRERMEELVGWLVVPMIGVMVWWGWLQVRDQVKSTPIMSILSDRAERAAP